MTYGVKVIQTQVVGEDKQYFYEELILKVEAQSFDEAYEKAEQYMQDTVFEYTNIYGKKVKIHNIDIIDCFLAFDEENGVQEVFSSIATNKRSMLEEEYYKVITSSCDEDELRPLLNMEFNGRIE